MESNKKIVYDGAYLERYRKGELSAAESHALEKASLEDPLLAEALEGFHGASRDPKPELEFLKQWVNERVEENQAAIRFLPKNRSMAPFLRVAAVFLGLIGAAWMTYLFWINPTQPQLAKSNSKVPVQTSPAPVPNTPSPTATTTPTTQSPPTNEKMPVAAAPITDPAPPQPKIASVKMSADAVESNVPLATPAPVSEAMVESAPKEKIAAKSVPEVDASLADDATPVGGWTAFETYMQRSRQAAPSANNTNANPVVVLSFGIGQDGRPQDIQVVNSAGTFYDEKAKELLNKGPNWQPGKNGKRTELRVRF